MTHMNRFYGYARVSTVGQNDTSIEAQLEYLRLQAESLGMPFEGHSEKKSGKSLAEREGLLNLISTSEEGDVIAVYDNSRLGRNTEENLNIINTLHKKGVKVQINSKFVDPTNPDDELFFSIQSSISTFQRKTQLLKSKAGINLKKKNGDWIMRGDLMGYEIIKSGKKITARIIEKEAVVIRYIFTRYAQGASILKITKELNEMVELKPLGKRFYEASIRRYIFKPIFMGYYFDESGIHANLPKMKRVEVEKHLVKSNIYPPIIEEELWWQVFDSYRKLTRTHSKQYEYRFSPYELTSVIRCGKCGAGYVHCYSKKVDKVYEYYSCLIHEKHCKPFIYSLPIRTIEDIMRSTLYITFNNPVELGKFFEDKRQQVEVSAQKVQQDIDALNEREKEINKRKNNLISAIEEGVISLGSIKDRMQEFDKDLQAINQRIQVLTYSLNSDEEELLDLINETREEQLEAFNHGNESFRRGKYLALIESALVHDGKLIVRYKNGKTFVIEMFRPRGKWRQKDYNITVAFAGRIQFTYVYNAQSRQLSYVPKENGGDDFIDYYNRISKGFVDHANDLLLV